LVIIDNKIVLNLNNKFFLKLIKNIILNKWIQQKNKPLRNQYRKKPLRNQYRNQLRKNKPLRNQYKKNQLRNQYKNQYRKKPHQK
jgi:hypothetical protein